MFQPIKVYIRSKHNQLSVNDQNMLISYVAKCFGFIKAIIRPNHMNWPNDGFNKAETCCHVTN